VWACCRWGCVAHDFAMYFVLWEIGLCKSALIF
jgi:hypothetical protein